MKAEAKSIAVSKIADSEEPDVDKNNDTHDQVQNREMPSDLTEKSNQVSKHSKRKSRLSQAEAEVNT